MHLETAELKEKIGAGDKPWVSESDLVKASQSTNTSTLKLQNSNVDDIDKILKQQLEETKKSDELITTIDPKEITEIPLSKDEIFTKLRKLKVPVTFFGETDQERYHRLRLLEINLSHSQKDKQKSHNENSSSEDEEASIQDELGTKRPRTVLEERKHEKCQKVRSWIRYVLSEMTKELEKREDKDTVKYKVDLTQNAQTRTDLEPLLWQLKNVEIGDKLLDNLHGIVVNCEAGDFKKAHDSFISIAIGNAAWIMGVTAVGLHTRAAQSKIATNKVSHLMNDETVRRYVQMVKRLVTFTENTHKKGKSE